MYSETPICYILGISIKTKQPRSSSRCRCVESKKHHTSTEMLISEDIPALVKATIPQTRLIKLAPCEASEHKLTQMMMEDSMIVH